MAPKAKVSASGDIGHGISFEVRPQKKGSPTVHVDVAGNRLPAFRLKDGKSVEEQVSTLQQVLEHIAKLAAAAPMEVDSAAGSSMAQPRQPQSAQPVEPPNVATTFLRQ